MPEPKKVTVAIDARLVQGTSTGDSSYWSGLLDGLSRIDAPAKFLLYSHLPQPADLTLDSRFKWVTLPARSQRWWSMVRFPLAARKMGAKAVHTQYSLSPLVGRTGITTIHDVSFLIGPEWFNSKDRLLLSRGVPNSIRRAAKVIAVSETCKSEIERFIPAALGKTAVTLLAAPPWIRRVDRNEAKQTLQADLGIRSRFILTVGTRWPRKNMKLAVDATSILAPRFPHVLVITGKPGWGNSELGRRGIATGYVDSDLLSCLYSAADLYLAPSRHEGFGIPVLEAFRCGCPVICSSGGSLPEVAGDAAIVESSWQATNWAAAIEKLLDDPSKIEQLKERGFQREKTFSWEQMAQSTFEVYRDVAR